MVTARAAPLELVAELMDVPAPPLLAPEVAAGARAVGALAASGDCQQAGNTLAGGKGAARRATYTSSARVGGSADAAGGGLRERYGAAVGVAVDCVCDRDARAIASVSSVAVGAAVSPGTARDGARDIHRAPPVFDAVTTPSVAPPPAPALPLVATAPPAPPVELAETLTKFAVVPEPLTLATAEPPFPALVLVPCPPAPPVAFVPRPKLPPPGLLAVAAELALPPAPAVLVAPDACAARASSCSLNEIQRAVA